MSDWRINGNVPAEMGLTLVGGQFAAGSASRVDLSAAVDFDAAEVIPTGTTVTITRDGNRFFEGKVRSVPRSGSASDERQNFVVEDAWAELERLTYQEPWLIRQSDYVGAIYSPTVVLGMDSGGTRINVGEQISEVLAFAISQGVDIAAGTMPTGMMLWPSEVTGMSCAQVIRNCLQYYPDWIPWLNHATSPPTFQVTPRATATALSVAVTDASALDVTRTDDRLPEGVRIIYQTAGLIDGEVYRTVAIDQYPTVSSAVKVAPAGPGILVTTVPLAGMQMQIQKQQVQARDLPEDQTTAKAYLKLKFPAVKDLADTDWDVTAWSTAVVPDDYTGDPVDAKLERHYGADRTDLPRELVRGNIAEWMQKNVGRVLVEYTVAASGSATPEEKKKIESLPKNFTVVATDAQTKIYKGVSSYEAAEDIPVGVAEAYYNTLVSGCVFSGSVRTSGAELPTDLGHGKKLNLTGSAAAEWTTMGAPIHTISWDLQTCEVVRNFGPNPDLSPSDFLEFLKLLNKRPYSSYSTNERTGETLGDDAQTSARGDSVGGFDGPETIYGSGGGGELPPLWPTYADGKVTVTRGQVCERVPGDADAVKNWLPHNLLSGGELAEFSITSGQAVYVVVYTAPDGGVGGDDAPGGGPVEVVVGTDAEVSVHYKPPCADDDAGATGKYFYKLAKLAGSTLEMVLAGSNIDHFREVPLMDNLSESGDDVFRPLKDYAFSGSKFNFRALKAGWGHKLEESDLTPIQGDYENIGSGKPVVVIPESGGDPDPPTEGPVQLRTIRHLNSSELTDAEIDGPQIKVELADGEGSDTGANDTILVRGNGVRGAILQDEDEVLKWGDGQVLTPGNPRLGMTGEYRIEGCNLVDPEDPESPRQVLLGFRFKNGFMTAHSVAAGTWVATDPESAVVIAVQDCCFLGADPEDMR